MLPGIIP